MIIKTAKFDDAEVISNLMSELGYHASTALIENKLSSIADSNFDEVFVAVIDEKIVGVISCHLISLFHVAGMCGRITSLVVSADAQGSGVGKALVAAADQYFVESDCIKAEVTSGDHRKVAHQFYEAQGYQEDERRFVKLYRK